MKAIINGAKCPNEDCESRNTPVKYSGHTVDGDRVRMRYCGDCHEKFPTVEIVLKGQSYYSLAHKHGGVVRGEGPFVTEVYPDTIELEYYPDGMITLEVVKGWRRDRPLCRRGKHELTENKGQCVECKKSNDRRRYLRGRAS